MQNTEGQQTDVNGAKVQTTVKYVQFDAYGLEQIPKGVMQKQANL